MRTLQRLLFHNWAWKLGSLGLAILLWFAVVGEPDLVTVQAAGVYFENLQSSLVIASDVPDSVQIELRGPSAVLNRESLSSVKILLNLSAVSTPGQQSYTISSRDVTLPDGVSFLSAVPSRIFLDFDRRASKQVPVRVDFRGVPAAGFRVASHNVDPPSVLVSGPATRLDQFETALTDLVDISGLGRSVDVAANAYVSDPMIQLESPTRVNVHVNIERGIPSP